MVDIQQIECKNQRQTSSNSRNIVLCEDVGVNESNSGVKIFTGNSQWPFLRMRSENMAKSRPNAAKSPKFEILNRKS